MDATSIAVLIVVGLTAMVAAIDVLKPEGK
jgi:hypothetical protein